MVKAGEGFYTSLGLQALPASFYERSMLVRPRDRDVVCHRAPGTVDFKDDLRIKMCIKPQRRRLRHHPSRARPQLLSARLQRPAVPLPGQRQRRRSRSDRRLHRALGDTRISVQIGLLDPGKVPSSDKDVGLLLRQAMDKVAFMPFAYIVDKWRGGCLTGRSRRPITTRPGSI